MKVDKELITKLPDGKIIFQPTKTWNDNRYILIIDTRLEDLSGNTLNYIFDSEVKLENKGSSQKLYSIEFKPSIN